MRKAAREAQSSGVGFPSRVLDFGRNIFLSIYFILTKTPRKFYILASQVAFYFSPVSSAGRPILKSHIHRSFVQYISSASAELSHTEKTISIYSLCRGAS